MLEPAPLRQHKLIPNAFLFPRESDQASKKSQKRTNKLQFQTMTKNSLLPVIINLAKHNTTSITVRIGQNPTLTITFNKHKPKPFFSNAVDFSNYTGQSMTRQDTQSIN